MVTTLFVVAACGGDRESNDRPVVMTTLFPQYDFARQIAGEYIDLEFIMPPGVSPHNYEPGPGRVIQMLEADLLLYSGDVLEPWVPRLINPNLGSSHLRVLDLSKNIELMQESDDHAHDHDDETDTVIEVFEVLNRNADEKVEAYVHGDHWDGSLPAIEVGETLSLGAHIVSNGGRVRELDSDGVHNGLTVEIYGEDAGVVELAQYGDHVHIKGVSEGIAQVVFNWTHDGEVRYSTPPINVVVGDHDADEDDHDHDDEADVVIETFEILNRRHDGARTAYIHGSHWHGSLPAVQVGETLSLGAHIVSGGGRVRELDSDGVHNGVTVEIYGEDAGVVELAQYGDHVHIKGVSEGIAQVVFSWTHDGEVRYTTPPINVVVGDHDDHDHGLIDPHFWNDPINAQIMVLDILEALVELLPEHEDALRANANAYLLELEALHEDYLSMRANVTLTTVMHGGHNAFGYLMRRYNIEYITPYRGFSIDAEPTPGAISDMIDTMRQYNIEHLFSEYLVSESVANTLAAETGATILYLYAAANAPADQFEAGITYLDMMRHNLEQYKIGLKYYGS